MRKLRLLWMIALASLVLGVSAQNSEKRWAIGGNVVRSVYIGDLNDTFFNFDDQLNIGGGLTINRYLNRFFDLGLYGSWSKLGASKNAPTPTYAEWFAASNLNSDGTRDWNATNFKTSSLFNASLQLRFKFLGQDNARFTPFILLTGGAVAYDNLRTEFADQTVRYREMAWHDDTNPVFAMTIGSGLGFDLRLSSAISLRYQAEIMWTEHENRDFVLSGNTHSDAFNNDWQFQHSLGLVWSFGGKKKDADADGVKDSKDLCPDTPAGVAVDANGCPIDSDGDGVADYLDQCPDTPAGVAVNENGCPVDSDGDGVADFLDQCPNTPRGCRIDENGCPIDSDGDGVCDGLDRCPDTPTGVRVDASGCPVDTDGDGVADFEDKCPTVRGPRSNNGCPVASTAIQPAVVHFATNLYNLTAESTRTLDAMITTLKANPEVQVKIEGHTDNTGPTEFNRALANSRANTVKQYLVRKGIDAKRIVSTEGFWYSRPVGDNETEQGRAQNRRAEVIAITVQ